MVPPGSNLRPPPENARLGGSNTDTTCAAHNVDRTNTQMSTGRDTAPTTAAAGPTGTILTARPPSAQKVLADGAAMICSSRTQSPAPGQMPVTTLRLWPHWMKSRRLTRSPAPAPQASTNLVSRTTARRRSAPVPAGSAPTRARFESAVMHGPDATGMDVPEPADCPDGFPALVHFTALTRHGRNANRARVSASRAGPQTRARTAVITPRCVRASAWLPGVSVAFPTACGPVSSGEHHRQACRPAGDPPCALLAPADGEAGPRLFHEHGSLGRHTGVRRYYR